MIFLTYILTMSIPFVATVAGDTWTEAKTAGLDLD